MSYGKVILAGVVATLAMTLLMVMAPMMGMPKMNVAAMLAGMLHMPVFVGWLMHFMIGIIFAFFYGAFVNGKLPVDNFVLRGLIYGLLVFVFAQMMFAIMRAMGIMPDGVNIMSVIGSMMGHLLYGLVLSFFFKQRTGINQDN